MPGHYITNTCIKHDHLLVLHTAISLAGLVNCYRFYALVTLTFDSAWV